MSTASISIGLIGAGGRLRSVVSKLLKVAGDRVKVTAVYDPDPVSIKNVRDSFGDHVTVCSSEDMLLQTSGIDWVFIGSWNSEHARQAIMALEAGKNVFCEKPLATNLEDCLKVAEAVRKTSQVFAYGLVLRYSPHYQKLKRLLAEGAIGEIISFEFNETLDPDHGGYIFGCWRKHRQNAGTHILEKCCHDLDLANWLIDSNPVKVASFGGKRFFLPENEVLQQQLGVDSEGRRAYHKWDTQPDADPFSSDSDIMDHQVAILEYANGVRATFHTNCNATLPERRFYICGTKGTLRADARSGVIELQKVGFDAVTQSLGEPIHDGHAGGDDYMAQHLADTLIHNLPPLAGINEALSSCVVAFAIDQALDENKVASVRKASSWPEYPDSARPSARESAVQVEVDICGV